MVRSNIRGAVALLAWLREHGTDLGHCTQAHLDEWTCGGTSIRFAARSFVEWCRKNRHIRPGLTIPPRETSAPIRPLDEDERWTLCRRLMHDDSVAIGDRFAGLLVLLYAQPLTVISRLPITSVIVEGTKTSLMLGEKPLLLQAALDTIAQQLLARRRGHITIGVTEDSPWLFPGGYVGQHLSDYHLGVRLTRIGIHSRSGRSSALSTLATQLPATVLTDLLGISIETATAWTQSGGHRARYAAELPGCPHPRA
ncbi:hypothetical protein [Streptomyces violaceusniger]|uniref:hypothetical protein n=1 Tax=Streptomyces violaceusniger TaxID=68280 RepID=UPI0001E4E9C7|nr:hypothetical protein [Streptomyces violaceusniger]